ncbi:MAG: NUDIX hydrolase [Actinomycetes bacterium]
MAQSDPNGVEVRDAATVMLLRDGPDGVEVCMLQRNLQSDYVGGAYVFPGGGVDPQDAGEDLAGMFLGRTDAAASRVLDVDQGGLAFWVAAIRESFEEAGLLLAETMAGERISFADPQVAARFEVHRRDVDSGRRRLAEICLQERLRLEVGNIHYFSRWVTPPGAPRRYDTRFFVAAAPEGQVALHDDAEVIATRWVTPEAALADQEAGRITMIFPTIRTMIALAKFDSAAQVLEHAAMQTEITPMLPFMKDFGAGLRIVLPATAEHPSGIYDAMTAQPILNEHSN